jgi:hypothetical protein
MKGVFGRLVSLTSLTNELRYKSIKDFYPLHHHQALESAGLNPKYNAYASRSVRLEQRERKAQRREEIMRQAKK